MGRRTQALKNLSPVPPIKTAKICVLNFWLLLTCWLILGMSLHLVGEDHSEKSREQVSGRSVLLSTDAV